MLLLSKILSLLIYPLSLGLFLLIAALVLRLTGAGRLANLLTVLVTVWLYFCATEFGASQLLGPLEAAYPAFADEELPGADAIVVSNHGGRQLDGTISSIRALPTASGCTSLLAAGLLLLRSESARVSNPLPSCAAWHAVRSARSIAQRVLVRARP